MTTATTPQVDQRQQIAKRVKEFTPALEGERPEGGQYQPIAEDAAGVLHGHSAILELDICVRPGLELRLYDPAAGVWLRNLDEAEDAWSDAQAAFDESARQNEAQATRIRELEAQLQQQGIAPPEPSV